MTALDWAVTAIGLLLFLAGRRPALQLVGVAWMVAPVAGLAVWGAPPVREADVVAVLLVPSLRDVLLITLGAAFGLLGVVVAERVFVESRLAKPSQGRPQW